MYTQYTQCTGPHLRNLFILLPADSRSTSSVPASLSSGTGRAQTLDLIVVYIGNGILTQYEFVEKLGAAIFWEVTANIQRGTFAVAVK